MLQEGGRGGIELEKLLKRAQKCIFLGSRKFVKSRSPFLPFSVGFAQKPQKISLGQGGGVTT